MEVLTVVLVILVATGILFEVARRLGVPYPSLLVLGGLGLAFVPGRSSASSASKRSGWRHDTAHARVGPNQLAPAAEVPAWRRVLAQFAGPAFPLPANSGVGLA